MRDAGLEDPAPIVIPGLILGYLVAEAPSILHWLRGRCGTNHAWLVQPERLERFREALRQLAHAGRAPLSEAAGHLLANIETVHCEWDVTPRISPASPLQGNEFEELARRVWRERQEHAALAEQLRNMTMSMRAHLAVNSPHALIFDEDLPPYSDHPRYLSTRYAQLCALLKLIERGGDNRAVSIPRVLGAGGLVVCPETRDVIFLRRSRTKTLHPGKLHVFGGNFEPNPNELGEHGRDRTIEDNAKREIFEEASIKIESLNGTLVLVHKESADPGILDDHPSDADAWKLLMRNLPVHYCGLSVDRGRRDAMLQYDGPEGRPEACNIAHLEPALRQVEDWVPAAWYTTMLWLWMGAPSQGVEGLVKPTDAIGIATNILQDR